LSFNSGERQTCPAQWLSTFGKGLSSASTVLSVTLGSRPAARMRVAQSLSRFSKSAFRRCSAPNADVHGAAFGPAPAAGNPWTTRVFLGVRGQFPRRRLCLPALLRGVYFLELGVDDTVAPATERPRRTSIAGHRLLRRAARAGSGGGTVDRLAEAREGL
jgi:hypothetical protein